MDIRSLWRSYRWFALGVFAGIAAAEALSFRLSPTIAWWIGGALVGVAPINSDRSRSPALTMATVLATGCAAALAHWLVARMS